MQRNRARCEKQSGRSLQRREGDILQILFPDRAHQPLKAFLKKYQHRPRDGYGSHHNGRHKLG